MPTVELIPNGNNFYGTAWQNDFTDVDEGSGAINDSDYIRSAVNNQKEFFDFSTSSALIGATISQIEFFYRAKKANNGAFTPQLYIGSTAYSGTNPTLTTSYANYSHTWTTNPADSAAWEKSDIDDLVAGFEMDIPRGFGNWSYVSATWIIVTYTTDYGNSVAGVDDVAKVNGTAVASIEKVIGV
jgi:hypothetical protein